MPATIRPIAVSETTTVSRRALSDTRRDPCDGIGTGARGEPGGSLHTRETQETKETKETKETQETQETKETKETQETQETKETQETQETG